MEDIQQPGYLTRIKKKWRAFAEAYFGPWVVRVLALVAGLGIVIMGIEGLDAAIGIPFLDEQVWFPVTKHLPTSAIPAVLALAFFLMSIAIAQHVAIRTELIAAQKSVDLAELRMEIKDLESKLRDHEAMAEMAAVLQRPADAVGKELSSVREERDSLAARIATMEHNSSISDEERMTLAKGYLRGALDGLRDAISANSTDDQLRCVRAAANAGQQVLHHKVQDAWHRMLRVDLPQIYAQLSALYAFVDDLEGEQLNDLFSRSDVDSRRGGYLVPY